MCVLVYTILKNDDERERERERAEREQREREREREGESMREREGGERTRERERERDLGPHWRSELGSGDACVHPDHSQGKVGSRNAGLVWT